MSDHEPFRIIRPGENTPYPHADRDDPAFATWQRHVEAGRIGNNPKPSEKTVGRRIAFSEALLGRKLRRHEGGTG